MIKFICTILLAYLILHSTAYSQSLNVGTYVPYVFSSQRNMDGDSVVFEVNPFVSVSTVYAFRRNHFILPEIGLVHHTGQADNSRVRTFFILYHLGYRFSQNMMLRYGIGTFATRISGKGGTVSLRDGDQQRDFAVPDTSQTTYTSTFNLGSEYRVNSNWAIKFDGLLMGALDSDKRNLSYMLSTAYYW